MAKPLLLKIAAGQFSGMRIINDSYFSELEVMYQDIAKNLDDAECYQIDSSKVTGAAFDLIIILFSVAAIAEIASFLYQVWKDHKRTGGIYVLVDPEEVVEILINEDTTENDIIIFQKKIKKIYRKTDLSELDKSLLNDIKYSGVWKKIKKSRALL